MRNSVTLSLYLCKTVFYGRLGGARGCWWTWLPMKRLFIQTSSMVKCSSTQDLINFWSRFWVPTKHKVSRKVSYGISPHIQSHTEVNKIKLCLMCLQGHCFSEQFDVLGGKQAGFLVTSFRDWSIICFNPNKFCCWLREEDSTNTGNSLLDQIESISRQGCFTSGRQEHCWFHSSKRSLPAPLNIPHCPAPTFTNYIL